MQEHEYIIKVHEYLKTLNKEETQKFYDELQKNKQLKSKEWTELFLNYIENNKGSKQLLNDSPLNILKKRFASGEISKEEYLEIKKEIEK